MKKRPDRGRLVICALLAVVIIAIYWPVANYGLVNMDDHCYVTNNRYVRSGLSVRNVAWAFSTFTEANWHPLTWVSLQLDCTIDPSHSRALHLTNLLLHLANTLFLFIVLELMTGSRWRSAFVAALFAVHPLHVESVAWVSERKDVLSTLFWMLTMLAYVCWVRAPSAKRYVLVVATFALGLLAKPMLVSLPILLLLIDIWPLGRLQFTSYRLQGAKVKRAATNAQNPKPNTRHLLIEKTPLFALAAASCVVTYVAQFRGGAMTELACYPLGMRLANAFVSYIAYLIKTIWPVRLAAFYPHPENTLPQWQVFVCAMLFMLASVLAVRAARRRSYITVGWFWYVISLVPVIGIVHVGLQGMADRYTYVPLIGIFLVIAWGVPEIVRRFFGATSGRFTIGLAITSILTLAVVAHKQVGVWRDDITLFGHAARVTKRNALAYASLGIAYQDRGQPKRALKEFYRGLAANPNYGPIHNCIGNALIAQGKLDEGLVHLCEAVRLRPKQPEAHYNLAIALSKKGLLDEAVAEYTEALVLKPNYADAHNNLAIVLMRQGRLHDALEHSRKATRLVPENVRFRRTLALALTQKGDVRAAMREYRAVLRLQPSDTIARFEIGRLLLNAGDSKSAIDEFRRVLRTDPKLVLTHINLAVALYDQKRYAEAWREVHIAQSHGLKPHPGFLAALRAKMPEPK
ncbi:MAG: tetratricopeptide repeat protein [Armatimonadetes bacterium]|nr:tetratricopeptide repeat protein [Armatimonadota bacterium]